MRRDTLPDIEEPIHLGMQVGAMPVEGPNRVEWQLLLLANQGLDANDSAQEVNQEKAIDEESRFGQIAESLPFQNLVVSIVGSDFSVVVVQIPNDFINIVATKMHVEHLGPDQAHLLDEKRREYKRLDMLRSLANPHKPHHVVAHVDDIFGLWQGKNHRPPDQHHIGQDEPVDATKPGLGRQLLVRILAEQTANCKVKTKNCRLSGVMDDATESHLREER